MTNLIIMSDSHNRVRLDKNFLNILSDSDYIIHLGDGNNEKAILKGLYGDKLVSVNGNCDFKNADYKIIQIEKVKLLLCHGHCFSVKSGLTHLTKECIAQGVDCGLYGHTHIADIKVVENGLTLVNPGSIGYDNSYCHMIIEGNIFDTKLLKRPRC